MALNVKQKYPGTQGGAAQLYASGTCLSLRRKEQVIYVLTRRHSYNNQSHTSLVLHERDWVFAWDDLIGWCLVGAWKVASAPRFRHALRQALTHTHVTHRMWCTQITWIWLCTRGKKRYKYCSFSHTKRSFRVLGHQCVVTMGNCLIWISLCMFFFPLIETVTYTCHYMTDRLERFDLKTSKLDLLKKKRHLPAGISTLIHRWINVGYHGWINVGLCFDFANWINVDVVTFHREIMTLFHRWNRDVVSPSYLQHWWIKVVL